MCNFTVADDDNMAYSESLYDHVTKLIIDRSVAFFKINAEVPNADVVLGRNLCGDGLGKYHSFAFVCVHIECILKRH